MGYSQIPLALRLVEVDCTVGVRAPIRPDIDPVLGSFLEVEEHAASEDAEKRWTAEGEDYIRYHRIVDIQSVPYDSEYYDEDNSEGDMDISMREICKVWEETHSIKYIA